MEALYGVAKGVNAPAIPNRLRIVAGAIHPVLDLDIWKPYWYPAWVFGGPQIPVVQLGMSKDKAQQILKDPKSSEHARGTAAKAMQTKDGIYINKVVGPKGYLGKLGFKLEAAGKVRVFAMVDA
jgi:hypothetical protein